MDLANKYGILVFFHIVFLRKSLICIQTARFVSKTVQGLVVVKNRMGMRFV